MKLYKARLTPTSQFITRLKGDTLFGQICWSIVHNYGKKRLETLLSTYDSRPFLVVSDAFATGYLPKPTMPSTYLGEKSEDKKINRKRVWLTMSELISGQYAQARDNATANAIDVKHSEIHNAINYKTFTTDSNNFAPFSVETMSLQKKDVYFLLNESQFSIEEFTEVLKLLQLSGYGKKSSIGMGRFELSSLDMVSVASDSKAFMTLSPSRLEGLETEYCFYDTFVRFGKHGGDRAFKNAFKTPILLADSGAVVQFKTSQQHQYLGQAIHNVSSVYKDTVHQGYSIVLPIKELL